MYSVTVKSYAKVNLSLNISGVQGGYHAIDSVVASIDLCDAVRVRARRDERINVYMRGCGSENIPPERNHAVRAGEAFVAAFGNCENRAAFVEKNRCDIEFMFASTINKAIAAFNDMTFTQSYSLLENIIYYGLRDVAEKLLSAEKKLPRPKI